MNDLNNERDFSFISATRNDLRFEACIRLVKKCLPAKA